MRSGRAQLAEAYIIVRNEEVFLTGAHITPLQDHVDAHRRDPVRARELAAQTRNENRPPHRRGGEEGLRVIPLDLQWKDGAAKLEVGPRQGRQHDKRATRKKTVTGSGTRPASCGSGESAGTLGAQPGLRRTQPPAQRAAWLRQTHATSLRSAQPGYARRTASCAACCLGCARRSLSAGLAALESRPARPQLRCLFASSLGATGFDVGREPRGAYRAAVPLIKHSANHSCQRRQLRSGSLRAVDLRPACAHATESGDAFMRISSRRATGRLVESHFRWRIVFPCCSGSGARQLKRRLRT